MYCFFSIDVIFLTKKKEKAKKKWDQITAKVFLLKQKTNNFAN